MKFRIMDEDGNTCVAEEIEEEKIHDDEAPVEAVESLTADEIKALKSLAAVADKLVKLASDDTEVADDEEELDEEIDADKEEVVDTDEDEDEKDDKKDDIHDSVGYINRTSKSTNDSIDAQDSIANAWAKRYGGNN